MALVVQNDNGDVANANGYIDLATFKSYHDDRANDYSAFADPKISAAIVKATDYLDTRFQFRGIAISTTQTTQWPRKAGSESILPWFDINFISPEADIIIGSDTFVALMGPDGQEIIGIPAAVKRACAEYALRALSNPLFVDAPPPTVGPQPGKLVQSYDVSVGSGAVSESITYAAPQSGAFVMPAYPAADMLLSRAGLISEGRQLVR